MSVIQGIDHEGVELVDCSPSRPKLTVQQPDHYYDIDRGTEIFFLSATQDETLVAVDRMYPLVAFGPTFQQRSLRRSRKKRLILAPFYFFRPIRSHFLREGVFGR